MARRILLLCPSVSIMKWLITGMIEITSLELPRDRLEIFLSTEKNTLRMKRALLRITLGQRPRVRSALG